MISTGKKEKLYFLTYLKKGGDVKSSGSQV